MAISRQLDPYEQLIVDLDGCVWLGGDPIPGSVEAIERVREAGRRIAFVTNNPRLTSEEQVRKLWGMGVRASLRDVVTVGSALQYRLAGSASGRTAFVIGSAALRRQVADAGVKLLNGTDLASRAEIVVVAGTDELSYGDLRDAALAARRGAEFLATSRDPTYPMPDGLWPGTGAVLAAVEIAAERTATIVGKPEPDLFTTALDRLGEGRTLVVGDRLDSDIAAAAKLGLDSALVLTGGATREEVAAFEGAAPTIVCESLATLVGDDA